MVVFILLKLFLFYGVLFVFGWQLARFVLNEKRIEALIPLAAVFGYTIYLFFLNALSCCIDIGINFYLLCFIFIFLSWFLYRVNSKRGKAEWGIGKSWRIILFVTAFLIMAGVGIVGMRFISGDEMSGYLPLAATVAQGNFPVKEVLAPDSVSQYHYGYILFVAAVSRITGLPVWFGYDFQNVISVGFLFLLGFLLIKDLCKNNFKAYIASLIMILGGNLNFLYGLKGPAILYQKYILHLPVEAPFKFLDNLMSGKFMLSVLVIKLSIFAWVMLGFFLTAAVIYLYFRAINDEKNWLKISLFTGIIFSFLALSAETFFGVLFIVFLSYPLIFAILKKDWGRGRFFFKISFVILFLGIAIASFQGGILTQTVKQTFFSYTLPMDYSFSITPEHLLRGLILTNENTFIPIFSSIVFLGWGWLIIFIIPAVICVLKKYFSLGLFLILLLFVSYFLPLVVTAGNSQGDFMRLQYLASFSWNLIFGLFLGWLLLFFRKKWQEVFVIILILGAAFQGLFYFIVFPFFPELQRGQPLFREPVKPNQVELELFDWVKGHTTIKDRFFAGGFGDKSISDLRLTLYTGRFAPTFFYGMSASLPHINRGIDKRIPETVWYEKVFKECDPLALRTLNYRYLYVNKYWPQGLEEKCLNQADLNLQLEFKETTPDDIARIYLIK